MKSNSFVSRGGDKLASVVTTLGLDFKDKTVLDVGSSTGGFTDFAIQNGAKKVIAVDKGTNQLHLKLHNNPKIELHERTVIGQFFTEQPIDIVLIDVSFISIQGVLPTILKFCQPNTQIIAMVKPQFEAKTDQKHQGIIKNERLRRQIFKDFENWARQRFVILNKADSKVAGSRGNLERFYLLKLIIPQP